MKTRMLLLLAVMTSLTLSAWGQYRPWQLPKGVALPGERFIECIIPGYSIRDKHLTEALKDLSHAYGLRLEAQIVASNQFLDPIISVDARQVSLKDLVNRILQASGFAEAEWHVDSSEADVFHIVLGRIPGSYPLSMKIASWAAPSGESPENVLLNLLLYIPELRQRFYGSAGSVGSKYPVQLGCVLVYRVANTTVLDIVQQISRISRKSWIFIYIKEDEKKSKLLVF